MDVSKINMNKLEKETANNARHIAVLNSEMGETRDHIKKVAEEVVVLRNNVSQMRDEVSGIRTDVDWIKRFFWIIASSSIGGLGVGMLNLLQK